MLSSLLPPPLSLIHPYLLSILIPQQFLYTPALSFFPLSFQLHLSLPVCYTSSTLSLLPSLASSSFNFLPVYPSTLTNTAQPICFTQPSLPDYVPPPSIISLSILLPSLTQLNPSLAPFLPSWLLATPLNFLHFYPSTLKNTPQPIPFTLPSLTRLRSSSLSSLPIPHRYITCFVSLAPPPPPLSLD
ncbi:hypothetical protein Pcinc_038779 [Petrolisthes cinctipes]|uniref:Uncharacterized protein n=1 Tax=Petrolisthes cinctipes TaxID=88211 RepID=A0AAE1EL87_PETCI|nr:hypothetical protein Pcinc_038779 [Petrolisthes cinctipes]